MNINDTIRQSMDNVPLIQSFLEKRTVRWWDAVENAPLITLMSGAVLACVGLVVYPHFIIPNLLMCLMGLMLLAEISLMPFLFKKVEKKASQIHLGANNEDMSKRIVPATQQDKLTAINELLKSDADRELVEKVIALSKTDLPAGFWSFLKEAAQKDIPEIVVPSTEEQMNNLLEQAQSNKISAPQNVIAFKKRSTKDF